MKSLIISVRNLFQLRRSLTPPPERYTSRWNKQKKAEYAKANASNNSDEIESIKLEMKEQSEKISKQFESISEFESELEELKNWSLRKTLIFKNIKYQQANKSS